MSEGLLQVLRQGPKPHDPLQAPLGRIQAAEASARHAWHIAYACAGAFLIALGYSWWLGAQAKTDLHLTTLNQDGRVLTSGPPSSITLDDAQIMTNLRDWITWARWRTDETTPVVEEMWHKRALAMTDKRARKDLEGFFKQVTEDKAKTLGNPLRVELTNFTQEKQAPSIYRFWWTEKWTPRYGTGSTLLKMSGVLTVEVRSSKGLFGPFLKVGDEDRSPTGIFVVEVSWIRLVEGS